MLEALFRNTLGPWQWTLLLLVPPAIIALYFLKLKRQPLEVPSTYLWKKSIEDLHVNSLWQRMRQNLLLLLQLLVVALAMLALLRPGWQGTRLEGQRFVFLVDNSASMQATDMTDAESRLDAAKARTRALIDQLESGMTAMIISFADTPRVVQEFTDNHRLLRDRLESIKPTYATTNLKGALELADGLANPGTGMAAEEGSEADAAGPRTATVFIFSDGRFDDVEGFSLGNLEARYVPIGSLAAENIAITTLATRRNDVRPDEQQAFVQVTNFTDEDREAVIELSLDGTFLDAQQVDVAAGESRGAVIPLADAPPGALEAKLDYQPAGGEVDALALDDRAFAALNEPSAGRVLVVSPGNPVLEAALETERAGRIGTVQWQTPQFLESEDYEVAAATGEYDLVIFDQCRPEQMPRSNTLFLGRLPPGPGWASGESASAESQEEPQESEAAAEPNREPRLASLPEIIDWNRSHPLLLHTEFSSVAIGDSLLVEPPPGGDVLIDAAAGPIAAIGPRDSFQDAVLGFEILGTNKDGETTINTNWPRMHSFPTFWLNVLEFLGNQRREGLAGSIQPGQSIQLALPMAIDEVTVVGPRGKWEALRRDPQGVFRFHDTSQPGVYEVRQGDRVWDRFAVNLFDRQESNVRVQPDEDSGAVVRAADIRIDGSDVAAVAGSTPARRELWKPLLIFALMILLVEWYIYNRRVYV